MRAMKWFMNKILDNSLNNYLSKAQLKELVRSLPAPGAVPWRYGHASARVESSDSPLFPLFALRTRAVSRAEGRYRKWPAHATKGDAAASSDEESDDDSSGGSRSLEHAHVPLQKCDRPPQPVVVEAGGVSTKRCGTDVRSPQGAYSSESPSDEESDDDSPGGSRSRKKHKKREECTYRKRGDHWDSVWGRQVIMLRLTRLEGGELVPYNEAKFRNRFRIPFDFYEELVVSLREKGGFEALLAPVAGRPKIPLELMFLGVLRIAARGWRLDDVAEMLDIASSTVGEFYHHFVYKYGTMKCFLSGHTRRADGGC